MYSTKIIESNVEKYEAATKTKLIRYDYARIAEIIPILTRVYNDGKPLRGWKKEEADFIRNEQVLSKLDFHYWCERYCHINYGGINQMGAGVMNLWESQKLLLKLVGKCEEDSWDSYNRGETSDGILIGHNKARQMGACLVAGTRVLTAELDWVPIETIKPGQKVVGFDEESGGRGIGRKFREATVIDTISMHAPTYKLKLANGVIFHGTPHHKFLCRARGAQSLVWRELQHMQPNDEIKRFLEPWEKGGSYEDGWFGGFLDGEGSCRPKKNGGSELTACQVEGGVLQRALEYVYDRDYTIRIESDEREAGSSSKLGDKPVYKIVINKLDQIFKIVGQCKPSRFTNSNWYEGKEAPQLKGDSVKVVSVNKSFDQWVYDIQTTTKTYLAEGFASHNTMICRAIIMHRETTHKNTRGFSASVDDDKVAELYTRDKNIHNNLAFYLRPSLDSRDESIDQQSQLLHYGKLNSSILYQTSNQKSGFGQGRTFDVSHITEAASFDADGRGFDMIEHDFLPTIPQAPTVFCLLESTPQGRGNTWHTWSEAVRLGNKARWKYLFVPAYINRDRNRRTPPVNWQPADHTLKYAIHIETTSPSVVGYKVTPDRDYLYWYETQRKEYYDSGKLNMFYTNFASTPEESFQFVTSGAFDAELLNDLSLDNEPGVSYEFEPASMRF